jgi:tetratricopeptide (TPR) repeat protein/transcriptional regulator with XRE-family HTH domain
MLTNISTACTHPLAFVRAQRGWSYQRLARVVAKRARDLGVANMAAERQKVWRWEHRGVVPDRVSQLALAAELGVPTEKIDSHPWPAWLPTGDAVRTEYPWDGAGATSALTDVVGDGLSDRRGFLTLTGDSVTALALDWLRLEPGQAVGALAGNGGVDAAVVNRIEYNIPGLRVMDNALGGESVRRVADAELHLVTGLLERGAHTEAIRARLYGVAAELARIAGWASFDAGFQTAAQRYWITALHAAQAGGDRIVGANVFKSMSLQCVDNDRPVEAVQLAQACVATARGVGGRTGAMFSSRLARAYASMGDPVECARAIARCEKELSEASSTEPAWSAYFDESEFAAQVGSCYIDLGRLIEADRWLARALDTLAEGRARDRATYLLRRAGAQMDLGNLDLGIDLVREALPVIESTNSTRNRSSAEGLRRRLRRHASHPQARELEAMLAQSS